MRYNWVRNIFIKVLTQKNANIALLHRHYHTPFHIVQIPGKAEQRTVH